jgi:hypothetical protein
MNRTVFTAFLLVTTFSTSFGEISESIRKYIENEAEGFSYKVDNENLLCGRQLHLFYVSRHHEPARAV